MSVDSQCELVQFKVESARFLHIEPRPRQGSPADLEETLLALVRAELEREHHTCGAGCDCVVGEPVRVAGREQVVRVHDGTFTAWYQVNLVKYRTAGECMPAEETLPEGARV